MRKWIPLGAIVLFVIAGRPADARYPACGPTSPSLYTTLGLARIRGRKLLPRSAQAIAAVLHPPRTTPLAWVVWDEQAMPWIVLSASSPEPLLGIPQQASSGGINGTISDIRRGARIFALRDRRVTLPEGYAIEACSPRS